MVFYMTIRSRDEMARKVQIDLRGQSGNSFALMAIADNIGKQLGVSKDDRDAITKDMMSSDYEHLVATLEKHYGDYIDIYEV